jgi:preprotein translocase subunit YajC
MLTTLLYAAGNEAAKGAAAAAPVTEGALPKQATGDMITGFVLPLAIIFGLFYFMFILPQKKEQKKHQEMIKALQEGDKVVISGGIIGVITGFDEKNGTIRIKSGENTTLNVLKEFVTKKVEKPA